MRILTIGHRIRYTMRKGLFLLVLKMATEKNVKKFTECSVKK